MFLLCSFTVYIGLLDFFHTHYEQDLPIAQPRVHHHNALATSKATELQCLLALSFTLTCASALYSVIDHIGPLLEGFFPFLFA